jgi:arylsulfatase A-like enzyme
VGLALALATPGEGARADSFAPASSRPNILLIISDDQSWSNFSRTLMPTVFSELVDRGALFRRAYVNTSLCCPSRSQIMTGLYGHHTGVDWNNVRLNRPTIIDGLEDLGYRTMLAGKYLNSHGCEPRAEFTKWACVGDIKARYTLVDPDVNVDGTWTHFTGYTTDILAGMVKNFIEATPTGTPFFAMYTPPTPHLPANDSRCFDYPVAPLHDAAFNEETRSVRKPEYVQRPPYTTSEIAQADNQHRTMTRAVKCLDGSVATILSALGNREADTAVFYLSDNGYLYGQHRRLYKVAPYEETMRVPFVVRYPRLIPQTQPFASDALVQNIDIAPTIADLAGLAWEADGKSLTPLLAKDVSTIRTEALIEHCQGTTYPCPWKHVGNQWGSVEVPSFYGVVTPGYKYVEYITGEKELYARSTDPSELMNLAGDAAYAAVEGQLSAKLSQLRQGRPGTTIATGPAGPQAGSRTFRFTYFSPSRFARYRCRLSKDGVVGIWKTCNGQSVVQGPLTDGDYVLHVQGIDEDEVADSTPAARVFSIRTLGPDVTIDSGPPADGSTRSATFRFSSTTPGVAFECRLARFGTTTSWNWCSSGKTYGSLTDGLWQFDVRAVDLTGATTAPPAQRLFQVDDGGPVIVFDAAPQAATQSLDARFVFHASEALAGTVSCRMDGGAPLDCTKGSFDARDLGVGMHSLAVTAKDKSGLSKATNYAWKIDRTPPVVTVSSGPAAYSSSTSATFTMSASETVRGRFCMLDNAFFFQPCSNPATYVNLKDGEHTFTAQVSDKAENYSQWATWTWTQDTVRPVVTISGGPTGVTSSRSASFTLSSNEPAAFRCSWDGASFAPCTSPATKTGLEDGPHSVSFLAVDRAGNTSAPVTRSWTVDTTP